MAQSQNVPGILGNSEKFGGAGAQNIYVSFSSTHSHRLLYISSIISFWFLLPVFLCATVSRCTRTSLVPFSCTNIALCIYFLVPYFFSLKSMSWKSPCAGLERASSFFLQLPSTPLCWCSTVYAASLMGRH